MRNEESSIENFWNQRRKRSKQNPHPRKCGERKCHRLGLHLATTIELREWRVPLRTQNPSPRHEVRGMYPSSHCIYDSLIFPCIIFSLLLPKHVLFSTIPCLNLENLQKNFKIFGPSIRPAGPTSFLLARGSKGWELGVIRKQRLKVGALNVQGQAARPHPGWLAPPLRLCPITTDVGHLTCRSRSVGHCRGSLAAAQGPTGLY